MPESRSRARGCLKYGCFGCLGMGALAIGFGAIIALVNLNADPERIERQELTQELPAREYPPAEDVTTEEEFAAAVEAGEFDASGNVYLGEYETENQYGAQHLQPEWNSQNITITAHIV